MLNKDKFVQVLTDTVLEYVDGVAVVEDKPLAAEEVSRLNDFVLYLIHGETFERLTK